MTEATYLPWWIGGLLLGGVVVTHLSLTGRLLSVSGIVSRTMRWNADERDRREELSLENGDLDQALLAATLAQFGPDAADLIESDEEKRTTPCGASPTVRLPIAAGVLFLVFLAVGGALSMTLATEGLSLEWSLGAGHERLVPSRIMQFTFSVIGGIFVGFGARMAGGCTSSHGLAGCARLQSGSLVSTVAFFAGGVATAFVIRGLA